MKKYFFIIFSLSLVFALVTCDRLGHKKRPYGYIRLGNLSNFTQSENYISDKGLVLFKDSNGYSAMSTYCTYDLSPLKRVKTGQGYIWKSQLTESAYDPMGKVLHGPASEDLPFYELIIAPESVEIQGQKLIKKHANTVYVYVGKVKPITWRYKFK